MTPDWLADFQARFGAMLRTPLDRASGTLTATPNAYDGALRDEAGARLSVYNRQYWFRLLDVMNQAYPLTSRLLGAWHFNEHAARYLEMHPPRHADLNRVPEDFAAWFEHPEPLVREATVLDAAFHRLLGAPAAKPFVPNSAEAARLLDARLGRSPSVALVGENAPLLALRQQTLGDPAEGAAPLPPPAARRHWMLVRDDTGVLQIELEPLEARLYELLDQLPVRDALGTLQSEAHDPQLPARTRGWLARAVQRGFFAGLDP